MEDEFWEKEEAEETNSKIGDVGELQPNRGSFQACRAALRLSFSAPARCSLPWGRRVDATSSAALPTKLRDKTTSNSKIYFTGFSRIAINPSAPGSSLNSSASTIANVSRAWQVAKLLRMQNACPHHLAFRRSSSNQNREYTWLK